MAENFPISTWDGVNSPWQNIQNWRVYGHDGSGTTNTGFRNYGATGVNTSYGTGLGETGFKQGMAVQRTQYRAPNAGVRQRFSGDDQIRSFNSAPMAGVVNKAMAQGRELFNDPNVLSSLPQQGFRGRVAQGMQKFFADPNAPQPAVQQPATPERVLATDPAVLARQQGAMQARAARASGTFQPEARPVVPMAKPSFEPDRPQYTPAQREQMRTEQRQRLGMPPVQPAPTPQPKTLTPQQQKAVAGVAAMRAKMAKSPAAETPSTSRTTKRARKSAIGSWGQGRINEALGLG